MDRFSHRKRGNKWRIERKKYKKSLFGIRTLYK